MWDTLITCTNTEEHEHIQCLLSHTEIRPHNKKLKHNHKNSGQGGRNFRVLALTLNVLMTVITIRLQRPFDGGTRSCACKQLGKEHPALQKHRLMTHSHPSARSTELLESCKPKDHYGKLEGKKKKKFNCPTLLSKFHFQFCHSKQQAHLQDFWRKNTKPVCISCAFFNWVGVYPPELIYISWDCN